MSPGNPYFKSRVIEDYVEYLGKEKRRIIVIVPQQPAELLEARMLSNGLRKILVSSSHTVGELLKSTVSKSRHFCQNLDILLHLLKLKNLSE